MRLVMPAEFIRFPAKMKNGTASRGKLAVELATRRSALRKQAADDLSRNEYVYFIDDTHWNDRGIGVAAQALMDAWKAKSPSVTR